MLVDQRRLPAEELDRAYGRWEDVADAIRTLVVRGAPAIGVAAAFGVALAARQSRATTFDALLGDLEAAIKGLAATRPTAVNLFWALERMRRVALASVGVPLDRVKARLLTEAPASRDADIAADRALGTHGATLVPANARILTHCNAGALATAGFGTALGVSRPDHAERRAEAGGRKGAGVAVGEDARVRRNERGAVGTQGPVRRDVRVATRRGLGEEPGLHPIERHADGREGHAPHPLERPEEVDGGRPRRRQAFDRRLEVSEKGVERRRPALARGERHAEGGRDADRRRASHDERPDRVGDVLPPPVRAVELLGGQAPLVHEHQPVVGPPDRRQEVIGVVGLHARRVRTSASVRPATRTRLSRLLFPPTTCTVAGATRSARATRATTAALAARSTGGAVTRTRRTPSCQPRISSREARGCTPTRSSARSALRPASLLTALACHP